LADLYGNKEYYKRKYQVFEKYGKAGYILSLYSKRNLFHNGS